jgi:hypothetical protein
MGTILEQGRFQTAHYIVSESNGFRSRGVGLVASGSGEVKPGAVLGKIATGSATAVASAGNTGDATISAVTLNAGAKAGAYTVEFTAATKFDVIDPEGFKIKSGSTGAAYNDDIGFTITAGATPMVAGDSFAITIVPGIGKYAPFDPAGTDGRQVAAAILYEGCDATDTDVRRTLTVRDTEVQEAVLVWIEGLTDDQKSAALAALAASGIVGR